MNPQWFIRRLETEDAALYQTLRLRGLAESPTAFASSYEEELDLAEHEIAQRLVNTAQKVTFGALASSRLVGIVGVGREHMLKLAHKAYLWGMYVDPEFRRFGIGRALVAQALDCAREMHGVRQVLLGVNAANLPALSLYDSLGFKAFGREPDFLLVNGKLHDEVHMVCRLIET